MKHIFFRNHGFGDSIWAEPIVRFFVGQGEEVSLYIKHSCIFDRYPTDRLFINQPEKLFPLTEEPISLRFEKYPQMHYLECFRKQAGIPELELTLPRLYLSEEEKTNLFPQPYVILHLDYYTELYNYRNAYNIDWKEVVSFLNKEGYAVYQISKKNQKHVSPWLPTKDFREIMSVLYNAALFIGLDSGPSHIASVFEIPSVIFLGSVNPYFRHLNSQNKIFLQSPCSHPHCYHELPDTFGQSCRLIKENEKPPCCIHDTEKVIKAVFSLLKKEKIL